MNTQTKPSAGALRAARAFNSIPRGWNKSNPAEELAEIIDKESGLAELLEAARATMEEFDDRYDGAPDSGHKWMSELMRKLELAIARAENPNAEKKGTV